MLLVFGGHIHMEREALLGRPLIISHTYDEQYQNFLSEFIERYNLEYPSAKPPDENL